MASSPQGIYIGLKTAMKKAYYTDNMVNNLENFRAEASAFLSGPGEYEDLSFLKICANLEGNGDISWNKLDSLKTLVQSASRGKKQLLNMINDAEREIQESLSGLASPLPPERDAPKRRMKAGLASPLPPERDAPKRRMKGLASRLPSERDAKKSRLKDEEMVVQMDRDVFRVKEKDAAFLECSVHPKPKRVVWRKGDENRVDKRIIINNRKYFGAGPSSPALVIKEAEKTDEAYYQCIANKYEKEAKGKAVPLKVDSNEERGSNKHGTHRSPSASSSGTEGSHIDRNSKSSSRSQDNHMEFHSFSPEDRHQGKQNTKELTIQILMSNCQMMFTISNYNDVARLFSFIEDAFYAATGEKKRIDKLDFKQKCIQVFITIKAANSLSEAPAVCLAEQFKHYILDVGLQLPEESNAILEVDEASIKITPEHMPEDGLPLVNISHQQGAVPHSESVILQTYIIASPPALSIEWFKIKADDHEISIEIDCKKYYGGSELSPSLIIRNINVDDQGWYICRATNKTGTACSNKTFVGISSDSTQAEDKPGKLVTDIIDTPEHSTQAEDKPGKLVTDIIDIPEHSTQAKDKPGKLVTDIIDITEHATQAEDKPGKLVTDNIDIPDSTQAEDKPGKLVTDIIDIPEEARYFEEAQGYFEGDKVVGFDVDEAQEAHYSGYSPHEAQEAHYSGYSPQALYRPPNQPRAMQVTNADRASLAISWNRPLRIVGSPVTGYIVEKRTAWTQVSKVSANELSCVADKLIEGTEYEFRITAVNEYGKGKALESDQTYMAKSPYKPLQTRDSPESAERYISDIKESLQTGDSPETTERHISGIKDLVPIEVWDRVPSKAEIKQIVTNIDNKFSNLFLELGLSPQIIEQHGQGHPVTFQVRMKALLRCWIDSSHAKPTIGSLLTAMKLCQMDWHTTAQIWSA